MHGQKMIQSSISCIWILDNCTRNWLDWLPKVPNLPKWLGLIAPKCLEGYGGKRDSIPDPHVFTAFIATARFVGSGMMWCIPRKFSKVNKRGIGISKKTVVSKEKKNSVSVFSIENKENCQKRRKNKRNISDILTEHKRQTICKSWRNKRQPHLSNLWKLINGVA